MEQFLFLVVAHALQLPLLCDVSMQTLYAKCPKQDKMKISKGIVAAVRARGGRFLEFDESTEIYTDIGDKRATDKTSQALREGQIQIRKQLYEEGLMKEEQYEMSFESYFGYSLQVLKNLDYEEGNSGAAYHERPPTATTPKPDVVASCLHSTDSAAMARVMDQFPGALNQKIHLNPSPSRHSIGRITNELCERPSFGRLTNMSIGSIFSYKTISQLAETERKSGDDQMNNRGTLGSVTEEILNLFRCEKPEVKVQHVHEENEGRVSELRFTDHSRENFNGGEGNRPTFRLTCSTDYSRSSMMDASIMTLGFEDMSICDGECDSGKVAVFL